MSTGHVNPYCDHTEWGWSIEPYDFYLMLMEYWRRYQLPILILENGLGHRDQLVEEDGVQRVHDQNRIKFLRDHIERMAQAVADGVEMVGYCTWAAIDLCSTREGFGKRYGFVYIDADHDFKRIKKDSFAWYAMSSLGMWGMAAAAALAWLVRETLLAVRCASAGLDTFSPHLALTNN